MFDTNVSEGFSYYYVIVIIFITTNCNSLCVLVDVHLLQPDLEFAHVGYCRFLASEIQINFCAMGSKMSDLFQAFRKLTARHSLYSSPNVPVNRNLNDARRRHHRSSFDFFFYLLVGFGNALLLLFSFGGF